MRLRATLPALAATMFVVVIAGSASAATWTWRPPLATLGANAITGVACPTARLCVAVDGSGHALTSTDPAGGSRAWTLTTVTHVPGGEGLVGVACPSASLCVAAGAFGDVVVSHDPGAGRGATWTDSLIDPQHLLTSISCPTTSLCVASDNEQSVLTNIHPGMPGGAWTRAAIATETDYECTKYEMRFCPVGLKSVSCPSAGLCVASDGQGYVLWSTEPAGGASAWSSADVTHSPYLASTAVSCPSRIFCAFASASGGPSAALFTSTAPASGAGTWAEQPVAGYVFALMCPLTTLCVANGGAPPNLMTQNPSSGTARWYRSAADRDAAITAVACPSSLMCIAGDDHGAVIVGTTQHPPAPRHRPTIAGRVAVGHRLTASPGTWSGSRPIAYAFQWQRCARRCVTLARATTHSLHVTAADRGRRLRVIVTASNLAGSTRRASVLTRRVI